MIIILEKEKIGNSADRFLKQAGYVYIYNRLEDKGSYARRLGRYFYPRFHLYVQERGDEFAFNLHLDQKRASYEGYKRHSGEYEGEVVEKEATRLKELAPGADFNRDQEKNFSARDPLSGFSLSLDNLKKERKTPSGRGFWKKILNFFGL